MLAPGTRRLVLRLWLVLRRLALGLAVLAVGLVLAFRVVNPPITWLMATERLRVGELRKDWVPIEEMSVYLPLSAVAAEDANFCNHWGFDLDGIRAALADDERLRGGSTISQQVAKNVFLWPGRSWLRKGLEAGFTVLIEIFWPKRRILEVYLNVAEFDAGVFGVEAAREVGDPGGRLQLALGRDGAGDAGDVLDAPGQPVLVLDRGEDDLGDAERGDGEIVRAQAERDLAYQIGGPRGEEPAHRPGDQHRQAEAAEIAGRRGVDRLDRQRGGLEEDAHDRVADQHHDQARRPPHARGEPVAQEQRRAQRADD
ncbi:monofunctional biosynthetic peptidoglycan transglycosylase [Amaricoccus sp. HAR-UPW-R2A-40]|nr:monofunctional biosynthetic peptidoglycan transglycosylase [Amaricoccus sp. HAR-UPW-R2A-40]